MASDNSSTWLQSFLHMKCQNLSIMNTSSTVRVALERPTEVRQVTGANIWTIVVHVSDHHGFGQSQLQSLDASNNHQDGWNVCLILDASMIHSL